MTYVKVSKFDFECMQRNSNRYKFLWRYAREIVVALPNGQKVNIRLDPNENMDETLDKFIDAMLKKQPIEEVEHVDL